MPTISVWSKRSENSKVFLMKFSVFTAKQSLDIVWACFRNFKVIRVHGGLYHVYKKRLFLDACVQAPQLQFNFISVFQGHMVLKQAICRSTIRNFHTFNVHK